MTSIADELEIFLVACWGVEMNSSVCLAAYNGSAFIAEQIESILTQLGPDDELIVVDDKSSDDTCDIVRRFNDDRIRLYVNARNLGVNANFEAAIRRASGDIIFLSDQDDIWLPGRLDLMKERISSGGASVVVSNYKLVDAGLRPLDIPWCPDLEETFDHRPIANVLGIVRGTRNYFGCAMAFRADLRFKLLPFPAGVESHDLWIAIFGIVDGHLQHLETQTLLHRVHGSNASVVSRPFLQRVFSRIRFASQLLVAIWRSSLRSSSAYTSALDPN